MICAGIDAGSRAIKAVLLDASTGRALASGLADQGVRQAALATELFERLLAESGAPREQLGRVVATGYARRIVSQADTAVTEITCHACGVRRVCPEARSVIEIGGQDSKLLHLDGNGAVRDFAMNDRCAAGTGRFLEVVADRLGVPLAKLGELAGRSRAPSAISSTCVVFAETEIVSLLAGGARPEDIAAGVQVAIAQRVASLAGGSLAEPVVLTGGVALVAGMPRALAEALGRDVAVALNPQMTGALGAAILACEQWRQGGE